jgi:hypothetical protein
MKILYTENGFDYCRNKKGQLVKVVSPKFSKEEIVADTKDMGIIRIKDMYYNEIEKQWYYEIQYLNLQNSSGGGSFYHDEGRFTKIHDPKLILMVQRIYHNRAITELKLSLLQQEEQLEKIEYALNLSVRDYKHVTHICTKCKSFFKGDFKEGNPNLSLCKNHLTPTANS